jgi:hypothetical protein
MYFMVVVVAAVDAVDNVSLAKSEPIRRCAYRCVDQKMTRGGSWDELRGNPTCPLIIPRLSREKITVVHNVFPTCVLSTFGPPRMPKIVWTLVIKDDPRMPVLRYISTLVIGNDPVISSAASSLLLDPVRQLSHLIEHAATLCHKRADLAISVHDGCVITTTELLSDLGQ